MLTNLTCRHGAHRVRGGRGTPSRLVSRRLASRGRVSAAAFEAHHVLHDGLARLGHFGGLASAVRAVLAHLLGLSGDLHADEFFDLVVALLARRRGTSSSEW